MITKPYMVLFCASLFVPLSVSAAPTLDQASLNAFNEELQVNFTKGRALNEQKIKDATFNFIKKLSGKVFVNDTFHKAYITPFGTGAISTSGFGVAPGVILAPDQTMVFRIPKVSNWGVKASLDLAIDNYGPIPDPKWYNPLNTKWGRINTTHIPLSLEISDINITLGVRVTGYNDGHIAIDNIMPPVLGPVTIYAGLNLDPLGLRDIIKNQLDTVAAPIYDAALAAVGTLESLNIVDVNKLLPPAIGDIPSVGGTVSYPVTPFDPDLEGIIMNIDDKIIDQNMPFGIIYEVKSNTPTYDSWEDAYRPGSCAKASGCGSPDPTGEPITTDDSAIWTGSYLAALAYRYSVLKDQKSLDYVKKALGGIEMLFAVNGNTGLLARSAAPETNPVVYNFISNLKTPFKHRAIINNVNWISQQGEGGISRDQYTGIMFGLRTAFDLVDDQNVQDRVYNLTKMITDYFIRNSWVVTEDKILPLSFASVPSLKISFLTIANHITAGLYDNQLQAAYASAKMGWLSNAVSSVSPLDSYYGWNLFYENMFSFFEIEHDPARRAIMMESAKIADFYIGHHANAWFDLVRASYTDDIAIKRSNMEQALELLKMRLKGGHRHIIPNNPDVQQWLTEIQYEDVYFGINKKNITTQPVNPALRSFGEFVWQRDPYKIYESENANIEQIGGDISLVYWVLRHEGYPVNVPAIMSVVDTLLLQ